MARSLPIAVSTGSLYPLPTLESIQHLQDIGVRDVELTLQASEFSLTFERELFMPIFPALKSRVQRGELCVRSVHAPSINAERAYNLRARLQLLVHTIEVCQLLGGGLVVIHPFHLFRFHEDALRYLAGQTSLKSSVLLPGLNDVMELAVSSNIKLALENIQDWVDEPFFNEPASMAKFLREVDQPVFGCTLDLMHAQVPGVLGDFLDTLATEIVNIHASDLLPPTKRVAVGKGVIDWERLGPELQQLPDLRQITVELSNPQDHDIPQSVKFMTALIS